MKKKDEIPEPTFLTLIGGFTIMDFNGHSSFYITYENEGEEFPIFFNRKGLTWKITQIEFRPEYASSYRKHFRQLKNSTRSFTGQK